MKKFLRCLVCIQAILALISLFPIIPLGIEDLVNEMMPNPSPRNIWLEISIISLCVNLACCILFHNIWLILKIKPDKNGIQFYSSKE